MYLQIIQPVKQVLHFTVYGIRILPTIMVTVHHYQIITYIILQTLQMVTWVKPQQAFTVHLLHGRRPCLTRVPMPTHKLQTHILSILQQICMQVISRQCLTEQVLCHHHIF